MLYDENSEKDFLKITVAVPRMVANLRSFIESGIYLKVYDQNRNETRVQLLRQTYEANLPYILRFLLDCNIVSGSWLKIPAGQYTLVSQSNYYTKQSNRSAWERTSNCSIEVVAEYDTVVSLPLEGEYEAIGPIKILSFDIECIKLNGSGTDAIAS